MNAPFKTCTGCGTVWSDRQDFISDPEVVLCGYQPDFVNLEQGLFLFTHRRAGCGTTLALPVQVFSDLVQRPLLSPRLTGSPDCPTHCFRMNDLEPCPALCECAYVRDVMQLLRREAPG